MRWEASVTDKGAFGKHAGEREDEVAGATSKVYDGGLHCTAILAPPAQKLPKYRRKASHLHSLALRARVHLRSARNHTYIRRISIEQPELTEVPMGECQVMTLQ